MTRATVLVLVVGRRGMPVLLVLLWFALGVIVAVGANTRGCTPVGRLLLSAIISPLLGGFLMFALPNRRNPYDGGKILIDRRGRPLYRMTAVGARVTREDRRLEIPTRA